MNYLHPYFWTSIYITYRALSPNSGLIVFIISQINLTINKQNTSSLGIPKKFTQ